MKKRTGRGSEPELTFNFRRRERLVVARSLCSLRSLASFFRFFRRKKNLPAMFYSAELLSKRSPLGAVWCVLTGSGRGREREGKRKRKKESERTAKRAPASSSLPSKKGGGALAPFHSTSEPTACTRRLGIDSHASRWSWIGEKELVCLPRAVGKRPPKDSLLLLSPFPVLSTLTSTQTTGFSPTARSSARSRS